MLALTTLKKLSTVAIGTSLVILGFADLSRAAALYKATLLIDPPTPLDMEDSFFSRIVANDINEAGEAIGTHYFYKGSRTFRWSPNSGLEWLGSSSFHFTQGNAINDAGIAVGSSIYYRYPIDAPAIRALLWNSGSLAQTLPHFSLPSDEAIANDINNRGQAVGQLTNNIEPSAVLWENNQILDLGIKGEATAINESSWVVGNTFNSSGSFLWKNGQITNLANLNAANDINNRGQVAGTSSCGSSTCAAIWDNGTLTQFGQNTVAEAINNLGWAVGYANTFSTPNQRAMLWKNGEAIDLNTAIDPSLGWVLQTARGINDKGQIVGMAIVRDPSPLNIWYSRPFLLTPIEEPTSVPESTPLLGLAGLGAGLALSRRYHRFGDRRKR